MLHYPKVGGSNLGSVIFPREKFAHFQYVRCIVAETPLLSQRKIDELNRQLDSIYRKVASQDQQIADLKASQVSSSEIKELID